MNNCKVFSNLSDVKKYCSFDNWDGNDEYAVELITLLAAEQFFEHNLPLEGNVEISSSGLVVLRIFVTSTKYIEILVGPFAHQIVLLNGKISFEKSFNNSAISVSCDALKALIQTYRYFLK